MGVGGEERGAVLAKAQSGGGEEASARAEQVGGRGLAGWLLRCLNLLQDW